MIRTKWSNRLHRKNPSNQSPYRLGEWTVSISRSIIEKIKPPYVKNRLSISIDFLDSGSKASVPIMTQNGCSKAEGRLVKGKGFSICLDACTFAQVHTRHGSMLVVERQFPSGSMISPTSKRLCAPSDHPTRGNKEANRT